MNFFLNMKRSVKFFAWFICKKIIYVITYSICRISIFWNFVILVLRELVYDKMLNFILKTSPNHFFHFWRKSKLSVKRYSNKAGINFMKQTPYYPEWNSFSSKLSTLIISCFITTIIILSWYFGLSSEPNLFWTEQISGRI